MKRIKPTRRHLLPVLALLIFWSAFVRGQHWVNTHAADRESPLSFMVNPALTVMTPSWAFSGVKIYHVGFLSESAWTLRHSLAGVSLNFNPQGKYGVGLSIVDLSASLFQRTDITLHLGRELLPNLAVGFGLSLIQFGFDESSFDLIEENDPLFQEGTRRNRLSFHTGLFYEWASGWSLGASAYHLNRPDFSLVGEGALQGILWETGLAWSRGFWRLAAGWGGESGRQWPRIEVVSHWIRSLDIRTGYDYTGLRFGLDLACFSRWLFGYEFSLPLSEAAQSTWGSHQVHVAWRIKPPPGQRNDVKISSRTDSLLLLRQWLTDTPDPVLDQVQWFLPPEISHAVSSGDTLSKRDFTPEYLNQLDSLAMSGFPVVLNFTDSTLSRAWRVADYLQKRGVSGHRIHWASRQDLPEEMATLRLADSMSVGRRRLRVYVSSAYATILVETRESRRTRRWHWEITNRKGRTVIAFAGRGRLPSRLDWDWKDASGQWVPPDMYRVKLLWQDESGTRQTSNPVWLRVTHRAMEAGRMRDKSTESSQQRRVYLYL